MDEIKLINIDIKEQQEFDTVEEAIQDIRDGKMVIVADNENREK